MKKLILIMLSVFVLCGCTSNSQTENPTKDIQINTNDNHVIELNNDKVLYDNQEVKQYDYTWHINLETGEEYYTGDIDETLDDVYIAHDIIYYPEIAEDKFVKEEYDDEVEWVYHYENDELKDYIFSTLPVLGEDLPTEMMHSENDAYNNPVLHITKAGTYTLQGNWHGQIAIDLGEDAYEDKDAVVTIILNGVDVTCDVAPSLIFYNVYESDNAFEEKDVYTNVVDISDAGAKVIIKDGTQNNFTGANVYRILKPTYKKEGSTVQKKLYKIDGAFYSFESMIIESEENGTGILNITSTTFEGLDTELHLTINSGYINIVSADDGINVNEDDVSVFTMNDGRLTIFAGQGAEGDVIDSNGYIKINGGTILGTTPSSPDEILDSSCGSEVSEQATVISSGATKNNMMNMGFGGMGDFKPENFDPNNMPQGMQNFNPDNMPQGNPPEKPQ